jgi:hypothetical protein
MGKGTRGCLASLGGLLAVLFSGQLGCFGVALGIVILWFLVAMIFKAIPLFFLLLKALLLIGAVFGLAITVRNYAMALYHNIKPEKVTP